MAPVNGRTTRAQSGVLLKKKITSNENNPIMKRKVESPSKGRKRAVLSDLETNRLNSYKSNPLQKKKVESPTNIQKRAALIDLETNKGKGVVNTTSAAIGPKILKPKPFGTAAKNCQNTDCSLRPLTRSFSKASLPTDNGLAVTKVNALPTTEAKNKKSTKLPGPKKISIPSISISTKTDSAKSDGSSPLYVTALEEQVEVPAVTGEVIFKGPELSPFDRELLDDPHQFSLYAMDIFEYLKSRESRFAVKNYMPHQTSLSRNMRAVLVDWMVETQENFELNHETLYLAVKIMDIFLSKVRTHKDKLQLVGATALFLACKYEERVYPLIDDFLQICDLAYSENEMLNLEQVMLRANNYELSAPISYSFLRRYGRCARIQMPLLTLARYILEMSLLEYNAVTLSESKQAAAALYLAFRMTNHSQWTGTMEFYSGYKQNDLKDVVLLFNDILHKSATSSLKVIKSKYSHKVFFEVAKTPLLKTEKLSLEFK